MKLCTRLTAALLTAALLLPIPAYAADEQKAAVPLSGSGTAAAAGEGTVIAVIAAGFDVTHPVFAFAPAEPTLTKEKVTARLGEDYGACYLSEKLPFVCDYVGLGLPPTPDAAFIGTLTDAVDADVSGISDEGTALASLAAGCYRGKGDTLQQDGTVLRDGDYTGTAPEAQLLLLKAASDLRGELVPEAVAAAILDALTLTADAICLDFATLTVTEEVRAALTKAERAGVPVFTGAGDMNENVQKLLRELPASLPERGTITGHAALPGVLAVGAAADPHAGVNYLLLSEEQIPYTDSSADYLGQSFAAFFAGETFTPVSVPGFGRGEDFDRLDVTGKIALVQRGEIPFAEKAKNAAAAGAVGLIVVNTGEGSERMALTDTTIPAVMVSAGDGARLNGAEVTAPAALYRAADFSARGLTGDFAATVSFITLGENLTAAVKDGYATRTGTVYAAARAAGYYACAVQHAGSTDALGILAAAARPLADSPRTVGCGLLDGSFVFPDILLTDAAGMPVSVPASGNRETFFAPLTVKNCGEETKTCTITTAFTAEEVSDDGILTGRRVPVSGITAFLPGGGDLCTAGEKITLAPGEEKALYLRVSLSAAARRTLSASAPYGFCIDGTVTLTGAETVTHPVTFFCGNTAAAPLIDATVYDDTAPCLAATGLSAVSVSDGFAMPLGAKNPFDPTAGYDAAFNLVNPRALSAGALQLKLTALREIDGVQIRVLDGNGRTVYENTSGPIPRYLVSGARATVPLWDFTAADEPDYVFPDGSYTVEVTAVRGRCTQTLTFPLTADSIRPTVTSLAFADDAEGRLFFTVDAADNTALREISVYDLARRYDPVDEASPVGAKEASLTFDVTAYDGESPLYLEITDYAGGCTVRRFTLTDVARYMEGQAES